MLIMKYLMLNGKFLILLTKCSTHLKWALPDSNSSCVPPHLSAHFLFVGTMLHSPSLTFLEFQMADLTSYLSGKGRNTEMKEEQSRNNSAVIKQYPGSSVRNTITIPLSYSAGIKAPTLTNSLLLLFRC